MTRQICRTVLLLLLAAGVIPVDAEQVLRFCLRAEPKTFHPARVADESSEAVRYLTGASLLRVNRQTQGLEPDLATAWKVSPGGASITFDLRSGVRFSDGTPFRADDVVHTFDILLDPELKSPIADTFRSPKGAVKVAAVADDRVRFTFPTPMAGIERLFDQVSILSARSPLKEKASLGPFVVAEHKPGIHLLLARNIHFWKRDERGRQLPYLDGIRLEIQQNRQLELMRFERRQLHLITSLEPEHFDRPAARRPDWVADVGPSLGAELVWFNQVDSAPIPGYKKAWFQSREFRRAISEAISRADMCRIVYRGHARPAAGPVSAANRFWFNQELRPHAWDPEGALRRLTGAGFRLAGEDLHDAAGNRVEFSIVTNAGNRARERMAAMMQQDLKKIGIRLNIDPLDFPSLIERIAKTYAYEACLLGLVNVDLDPNSQMNVWLSSGSHHQWNPRQKEPATEWEAEIDKLMRAQASATDRTVRKKHFDRVQRIVWEQAPFLYLINKNVLVAVSPAVGNAVPVLLSPHVFWNAERLTLDGNGLVTRR